MDILVSPYYTVSNLLPHIASVLKAQIRMKGKLYGNCSSDWFIGAWNNFRINTWLVINLRFLYKTLSYKYL